LSHRAGNDLVERLKRSLDEKESNSQMNLPHPVMTPDLLERYLNLLGVQRRKPGIDALHELVQAQLVKVPFENVSKLYYKKHHNHQGLPNLEFVLDGIERFHFGGTCYANNYYFYQLLANLGYQISLCGADMLKPDVHLVGVLTVEQREYLVDVGYAAPFLNALPRDLTTDYVIVLGRDQYVLKPQDAQGRSQMELFRDGSLKHSYLVNPVPRQIQEFDHIIVDSYREDSTFMNALLLARFFPNRSLVLHNLTVIESQGNVSRSKMLTSRDELVQAAYEYFMIPKEFTMDVLKDIGQFDDAWH
jgi:arylamine N-acetyltransferase